MTRPNIDLSNFDTIDDAAEDDLGSLLAKRPAAVPAPVPASAEKTPAAAEPPTPAKRRKKAPAKKKAPVAPVSDSADLGVKASNVHIPIELMEPLKIRKAEEGLSNGEVIIAALESTYAALGKRIKPTAETGGSLFSARRSKVARTVTGPLTSLNYRLNADDYAVLDRLVAELGATSRGHLVTEALALYLKINRS